VVQVALASLNNLGSSLRAGQFTGATGTADLSGEFFDDGSFSFNFDGTITY
jgi:hypothetical protein